MSETLPTNAYRVVESEVFALLDMLSNHFTVVDTDETTERQPALIALMDAGLVETQCRLTCVNRATRRQFELRFILSGGLPRKSLCEVAMAEALAVLGNPTEIMDAGACELRIVFDKARLTLDGIIKKQWPREGLHGYLLPRIIGVESPAEFVLSSPEFGEPSSPFAVSESPAETLHTNAKVDAAEFSESTPVVKCIPQPTEQIDAESRAVAILMFYHKRTGKVMKMNDLVKMVNVSRSTLYKQSLLTNARKALKDASEHSAVGPPRGFSTASGGLESICEDEERDMK